MTSLRFTDCELCPTCGSNETRIVYRRLVDGIYERRHACNVNADHQRWNSYQSFFDPRRVKQRPVVRSLPVDTGDAIT